MPTKLSLFLRIEWPNGVVSDGFANCSRCCRDGIFYLFGDNVLAEGGEVVRGSTGNKDTWSFCIDKSYGITDDVAPNTTQLVRMIA